MSQSSSYDPELDAPVWGAKEIAAVIKRTERATYHLLEQGHLDADKIGGSWRSSRRRLNQPKPQTRENVA